MYNVYVAWQDFRDNVADSKADGFRVGEEGDDFHLPAAVGTDADVHGEHPFEVCIHVSIQKLKQIHDACHPAGLKKD